MGLVRPSASSRGRKSNRDRSQQELMLLLVGFLMGGLLVYLMMIPLHTIEVQMDNEDVSVMGTVRLGGHTGIFVPRHHGWHTIHVFYGDENGLKIEEGEEWFGQVHQDEIILDLVGENGYFIDLAANDAKEFSNTLALEKHGWDGLCIEPNPRYWYGLSHRKCTVVGALVGDKVSKVNVKFRGVFGGVVGKMDEKLANRKREPLAPSEYRYTAPFVALLNQFKVPRVVNYMSLDVEGMEYDIMEHFPFSRITIEILTAERPSKELRDLLIQHGYVFLKDLAWWGETLWAHNSTGYSPEHPKIMKIKTYEQN